MAEGVSPTVARRQAWLAFPEPASPTLQVTTGPDWSLSKSGNRRFGSGVRTIGDREATAKHRVYFDGVQHEAADEEDTITFIRQALENGNQNRWAWGACIKTNSRVRRRARHKRVESPQMENLNAPAWRKSSRCGTATCVEVAKIDDTYLIRDSKNPEVAALSFTKAEWEAFVEGVNAGEFRF
jgi:hypothetical protein